MKKLKIYALISMIIWLISYVWISVSYMLYGNAYVPSLSGQICLLLLGVNMFSITIFLLIRQIKKL